MLINRLWNKPAATLSVDYFLAFGLLGMTNELLMLRILNFVWRL